MARIGVSRRAKRFNHPSRVAGLEEEEKEEYDASLSLSLSLSKSKELLQNSQKPQTGNLNRGLARRRRGLPAGGVACPPEEGYADERMATGSSFRVRYIRCSRR